MLAALAGLFAAQAFALGVPDWTKIKAGLNGDEAMKLLGQPLLRTTGRGFDVWIYDGHGEVVFAGGPLKGWTVATPTAESLARPIAQDVLIRAVRRPTRTRLAPVQALPVVQTSQEISATHFRYLQQ